MFGYEDELKSGFQEERDKQSAEIAKLTAELSQVKDVAFRWQNAAMDLERQLRQAEENMKSVNTTRRQLQLEQDLALDKLKIATEALEYYAKHPSVIAEAYHSNDEKQITCVHTFINHKAVEALEQIRAKGME